MRAFALRSRAWMVRCRTKLCWMILVLFGLSITQALPSVHVWADDATQPAAQESSERWTRLEIFPSQIHLADRRAESQLVVTAFDAAGNAVDVTSECDFKIDDASIGSIRKGLVQPLRDGHTALSVQLGDLTAFAEVTVEGHDRRRPVAFESEVLVALSKQGCNSGACHGSPSGKGGFRLSLRAFDAQLDSLTITQEELGRRINRLEPERSLLLEKPLMLVAHAGGQQLRKSDVAYDVLREWIAGGAPLDRPSSPRIVKVEVFPKERRVLPAPHRRQQLAVHAHYSDGTSRDVTRLASYSSSNESVATVDANGLVQASQRGEAAILVRVLEHIETLPLMFVEQVPGFHWPDPRENNEIDRLVDAKLQQMQFVPADICSDAEFIRRTSLDITGLLPDAAKSRRFLASTDIDKRSRWIDSLLERPEYAKFWALKWGDWLRLTNKRIGDDAIYKYHRWIEESLRTNKPYDQFVSELISASGSTLSNPPANFYRTAGDMHECVESFSQLFLGARLQCAKCHNHPFERWTQDNYYGLAAFFDRVQRKKTSRPGEAFVWYSDTGDVKQPRTGQVMQPWLPQVGSLTLADGVDRRESLVQWLVKPDNPYLGRIEVNRIWGELFIRGIVDPVDDFRESNPPTNVELLDYLTKEFVEHGYDRKHILRLILNSRTYQSSYRTTPLNEGDGLYFSHQEPRLLGAEQLLDAINHVTGVYDAFGGLPEGTRATQLPAPDIAKIDFLKVFGQPERSTVCACERSSESNLGMAIEFFNGSFIHQKLRNEKNRFRVAIAAGKSDDEIVRELYLLALCREPSEGELQVAAIKSNRGRIAALASKTSFGP